MPKIAHPIQLNYLHTVKETAFCTQSHTDFKPNTKGSLLFVPLYIESSNIMQMVVLKTPSPTNGVIIIPWVHLPNMHLP